MRNTIFGICLVLPLLLQAQTPHPWEGGIGMSMVGYHGETNQLTFGGPIYEINAGGSIHLRKNISNNFSARIQLLFTRLSGDDKHYTDQAWRVARGLSFSSPLFEISALGEIYPFGLYKKKGGDSGGLSNTRRLAEPFFAIGIGLTTNKPSVSWNDENANAYLDPVLVAIDKNHTPKPDISIPIGLGIRFRATNRFTLGIEGFAMPTLNDYLDGVSLAGDPGHNDWFASASISGSYAFGGNRKKSPKAYHRPSNADDKIPSSDSDEDDVPDERDDCPEIPGLRSLKGCPDADRDGIADKDDKCPEAAGIPALSGCPDTDGDGITDLEDNCPDVKGVAAYRGCPPIDRDKDGVADAEDLCPDMSGQLYWKGCPDSDSDGIPDNKDACPGIAGPDKLRGCPDSDDDGISDKDDECPTISGLPEKKGCPEAAPPAPGVPYKALYFNSTLQDWQPTSAATLEEAVSILKADPDLYARIEGHTDNTGQEPANDLLSEKRAKKCYDEMIGKGIEARRLNYLGFGSQRPAVPNDTRQNRQLNRRVEIHFYRKK